MKKYLTYFLILILPLFLCACGKESSKKESSKAEQIPVYEKIISSGKMRVGIILNSKPMTYSDSNGNPTGFEIDLAREIAKRLIGANAQVEFIPVTNNDRIEAVNNGTVDMVIATMTINDYRKISVYFSKPYYLAAQTIMVRGNSDIKTVSDLNNRKIGTVTGTTSEQSLRHFAPYAVPARQKSFIENVRDVKAGNADALIQDDVLILGYMKDNPGYRMFSQKLTVEPYGIAFKKSPDSQILMKHVDMILDDLKDDGTLNKLKMKYNLK